MLGDIKRDTKDREDPIIDEQTTNIRVQVLNTVNICLAKQNAPSTIVSYEAILNKEVGYAQDKMDTVLLPLVTEEKFLALFGLLKLNNPDLKWSRVQALKAALKKWHSRRDLECVFDRWTPIMRALWTGLSRSARHAAKGEDPIQACAAVAAPVIASFEGDGSAGSCCSCGLRDIVCCCYVCACYHAFAE